MADQREEEDAFEEDIVFDQSGLLQSSKMNTAIRRISSGKCTLFAKTLGLCGAFFGLVSDNYVKYLPIHYFC